MDSPLTAIGVTVLFCADLDASTAFYRDTLGAILVNADPQSAFLDLAGSKILLLSPEGAIDLVDDGIATGAGTPPTGELVCFVDDIDDVVAVLAQRGVTFLRGPEDRRWGMRTAHFADPDGHVWELAQSIDSSGPS
ncbi:MAG: VOC family protein [Acidimicrobiales bacterium]